MKRIARIVFGILFTLLLAAGAAQAGIVTDLVEYKDGDVALEGYIAYDESIEGKVPAVLVFHEWKGLNAYAKKRANQLAELGYVAFAADIYGKGVRPSNNEEAGAEAGKYKGNRELMRQRANAALAVLREHPLVDPQRIAAIGYCFGGTCALELARSGADVKGAVSFHGNLSTPNPADAANIKAKLLVLHGAADPYVKEEEIQALRDEVAAAGVDMEFVPYPGAVHGFTNSDNGSDPSTGVAYDEGADVNSWIRMTEFFDKVFGE